MIEVVPWKKNHCGIYQIGIYLALSSFCCDRLYDYVEGGDISICLGCRNEYAPLCVDGKVYLITIELHKATSEQVADWIGTWRRDLKGCEVQIT